MHTTILFLAANPDGVTKLALDKECRAIRERIRSSGFPKELKLEAEWAVRVTDLLHRLMDYSPRIVHFSGHGSRTDELIFHNDADKPAAVSKNALRNLFRVLRGNIQLVMLNACYSRRQAEAIVEFVDCAIGMKRAIGDRAAITFAAAFYQAIGFGQSVQNAFDQGRVALELEGIPESGTPQLHVRKGVDPDRIFLIGAHASRPKPNDSIVSASDAPDQAVQQRIAARQAFECDVSLLVGQKIDLLEFLTPFQSGLDKDGLGELRKGLHLGRPRRLQLECSDGEIRLNTYPALIDVGAGNRTATVRLRPCEGKDLLYELRPSGNRSRVRLAVKVPREDPLRLILSEERENPQAVIFTIQPPPI